MNKYINIGTNTLYQVLSRALSALVALINTRLLTTYLGAAGYGQYQIAAVYVSLFWILTDFGLDTLVIREITADDSKTQTFFSRLFSLRLAIGIVLTLLAIIVMLILPYERPIRMAIAVGVLTIIFQSLMGAGIALFQAKLQFKYFFRTYLVGSVILLLGVYTTLQFSHSIVLLMTLYTFSIFGMMVTSLYYAREWVILKFSTSFNDVKQLFIRTIPFGLIILFDLGILKLDALLLSALPLSDSSNDVAVGIYNVAYKIYELATVVGLFFVNAIYPILNRQFSTNYFRPFVKFSAIALILLSGMGIIGTVLVFILAPTFITLLTDLGEFYPSIQILQLLAFGLVPVFIATLGKIILIIFDKQKQLVWVYMAGFVFNLITNLIFIPRFTYYAAAITTILTQTIVMVLLILLIMVHAERNGLTASLLFVKSDVNADISVKNDV